MLITDGQATVDIIDDSTLLLVRDAVAVEGGTLEFPVSLSREEQKDTVLTWRLRPDSAGAGTDYSTTTRGEVTIPAMSTSTTIQVATVEDEVAEHDETLKLNVHKKSGPTRVVGSAVSATGEIKDDDSAGVTVTPEVLPVDENDSANYNIKLDTKPTQDVFIGFSVRNASESPISVETPRLRFTPENWNVEQAVTVSAADDPDAANSTEVVQHRVTSHDYHYGANRGAYAKNVVVNVVDDDTPELALSEEKISVEEGNPTGTAYTLKLSTRPSETVIVAIYGRRDTDLILDKSLLTFTRSDWAEEQRVNVTAEEDEDATDDEVTLRHSSTGGDYDGVSKNMNVQVRDDDAAGVDVKPTSLDITEGSEDTYTVVLMSQPSSNVSVTITRSGNTDVTFSPPGPLTFTPDDWDEAQTVTVRAAEGADAKDDTATLKHAVSAATGP